VDERKKMKHARGDYNRIQDPENLIPEDEPVFLIRGQDKIGPDVLRYYAFRNEKVGGDPIITEMVNKQARLMENWPKKKIADL
jgi:hypothetical protein